MVFQIGSSWYSQVIYRRNRKMIMDEHREVHNRLHPLYKHDELKFYHYPERHPDMEITAQSGILGNK